MRIERQNRGFTLLEIILVIVAIGILAAIVLVAINPNRQLAQVRNLVRQADINTIQKALEQYLIENGRYPNSVSTTPGYICNTGTEQAGGSTNCSGRVDLRELVPTYIAGMPKDPQSTGTNTGYIVAINPDNNKVGVFAELAEGKLISINPYIINNGLVLHLDAGNPISYPGTGNTWFNLSGNNNGTLINGVGYNSSNGGSLVFDGVNDFVGFNSFNFGNEITVACFIRPASTNTIKTIFSNSSGGVASNGIRLFLNHFNSNSRSIRIEVGNGTTGGTYVISPNNTIIYNNWQQVAFTLSKTTAIGSVYHNGVSVGTGTLGVTNYNSNATFRLGLFTDNGFPYNGRVSNCVLYNRVLSAVEIQQNFNATRGRFGL